jgi:hypothetical protein
LLLAFGHRSSDWPGWSRLRKPGHLKS